MHYDNEIDTSGLNCPLPILRTKKALATMDSGTRLHVIATDPGSVPDFAAFARQTGHILERSEELDGKFHFVLCKA
jgi:tRNA 2-thiouridine synthesizing protein A